MYIQCCWVRFYIHFSFTAYKFNDIIICKVPLNWKWQYGEKIGGIEVCTTAIKLQLSMDHALRILIGYVEYKVHNTSKYLQKYYKLMVWIALF